LFPFFAVATVGTTSSTAVDDISKLGPICSKENIWLHVDAAFVGSSCICPEFRDYLNGIEDASSFVYNPHKWMLTNFDCSTLWVQERIHLLNALDITPEYLRNKASESGSVIDYRNWQIPLGRRFRALKLWFVIRTYGIEGLQSFIRHVRESFHLILFSILKWQNGLKMKSKKMKDLKFVLKELQHWFVFD
jgi:aromatic-L-amino-acid/L-tryptophan decarboxylase